MKILNYTKFLESFSVDNILESMSIIEKDLISSISGEELDLFETLKLVKEDFTKKDLDYLSENVEFINSLSSLGLKKSTVQDTDDIETFLNISLKFMFIYNIESNELENPVYLILEMWDEDKMEWTNVKLFKVNDDVKRFYDILSSKTIERKDELQKEFIKNDVEKQVLNELNYRIELLTFRVLPISHKLNLNLELCF